MCITYTFRELTKYTICVIIYALQYEAGDNMTFGEKLKKARQEANLSQKEMADKLDINARTYGSYERDERDVSTAVLLKICNVLHISSDELLETNALRTADTIDFDNILPIQPRRFPMLGEIACGEPIWADENKEHYVMADMDIQADFCLRAKGDSMINARIHDGDIVFIKQAEIVNNGEIAAVIIDNEATLKRVYYYPEKNKLVLNPENPKYEPLVYLNEELETIRILGRAVYFMSAL